MLQSSQSGEKLEVLEEAKLQIYPREQCPQKWADTQNNLGIPYSERIEKDRAENHQKAIAAFNAAWQMIMFPHPLSTYSSLVILHSRN